MSAARRKSSRPCKFCGVLFYEKPSKIRQFCSRVCYGASIISSFTPDTCAFDGCVSLVLAKGWCSMHYQRVKDTGSPGNSAVSVMQGVPIICAVCCAAFRVPPSQVKNGRKFCSRACSTKGRKYHLSLVPREPGNFYRRFGEMLRERDGDSCQLCMDLIDFDLPLRDLDTGEWNGAKASVDHIIPKSWFPEELDPDDISNLWLAHLWCNLSKGRSFVGRFDGTTHVIDERLIDVWGIVA